MKQNGIEQKNPTGRGVDNSFSSEEESSSSEDDEMDEGMRMAIQLSKEQEDIDKKKRQQMQGAMSETDGFKMAMEMSMNEGKATPTAKGMDMQSMMSDTAGFQKILEMSKREEDARLAKQKTIQDNENKLIQEGIRKSTAKEE